MTQRSPQTPVAPGSRPAGPLPWWERLVRWLLAPLFAAPRPPDPVDLATLDGSDERRLAKRLDARARGCLDAAVARATTLGVAPGASLWAQELLAAPEVREALANEGIDAALVAAHVESAAQDVRPRGSGDSAWSAGLKASIGWTADGDSPISPLAALCVLGLVGGQGQDGGMEDVATARVLHSELPLGRLLMPAFGYVAGAPGSFVLRLHNDNVTTYPEVIQALVSIGFRSIQATLFAIHIDKLGHGDISGVSLKDAQRLESELWEWRANTGAPLQFSVRSMDDNGGDGSVNPEAR